MINLQKNNRLDVANMEEEIGMFFFKKKNIIESY